MYDNYFKIQKTMSICYFFEQIKEFHKKNYFASECTHFMSACNLEFLIYKYNIELYRYWNKKKGTINNK